MQAGHGGAIAESYVATVVAQMKAKLNNSSSLDHRKEVESQAEALEKLEKIRAARGLQAAPAEPNALGLDARLDDDEVLLRQLLDLDGDKNGIVDRSELERMQLGADTKDVLLKALQPQDPQKASGEQIDFMALKAALRKVPRVAGQRTAFVRSMGLDADLARHIPPGTLDDGLEGLKGMSQAQVGLALEAFFADARRKFVMEWETARRPGSTASKSAVEANSKFDGFDGSFATLDDFHKGQDLGFPNPDLLKGIRLEHTAHPSSNKLFVSSNYRLVTSLSIEFAWAMLDEELDALAEAKKLLARLRKEASEHEGGRGEVEVLKASSDELFFFPGEVGDSFQESLVFVSWQGPVDRKRIEDLEKAALKAIEKAGTSVLATEEETARGVETMSRYACAEWLATSASVLQRDRAAVATSDPDVGFVLGVVLPMCKARADSKCAALKQAVAEEMESILAGVPVDVSVKAGKMWFYCDDVDTKGKGKRLGDMGMKELEELCSDAGGGNRAQLIASVLKSFLETELRADLREALGNASDAQLESLLAGWGVRGDSRAERIDAAAEALNSADRWGEVEGWVRLYRGRIQGRKRLGIKKLMEREKEMIRKCHLILEELLATYLYTGPGFIPMNSICRNYPEKMIKLLEGEDGGEANRLCTTIFCVSSALKKLGRSTEVPASRTVYRGIGKMKLPGQFWTPSGDPPWRGGVERAFMSTTADKDVALFYADGKGTVVEIAVGRVQIGGDVSFLSMVRAHPRPADRTRVVYVWRPLSPPPRCCLLRAGGAVLTRCPVRTAVPC